jgi:hypothetical protein
MNANQPVAWMNAHTGHLCNGGFLMTKMQDYIPLYTHPAKTLTDEEIKEEIDKMFGEICNPDFLQDEIDFARAIIKKASEK